ncbi:hypothetical protein Tco_1107669 [Tanacetum coccineum]
MADENVPAPAPTRSDDQILPFAAWVPIGKSNHVLDLQKRQKNPIFQIAVDILQNINFFRAFTASASVLAIYIQQFWNTLTYVEKAGTYRFQLDENWFTLDVNLLSMAVNHLYQPWRAILSMINQCLTGKTFGHDRPRYPVLQMLWGIITSINVDFAELMWEEFVQAIQTFLTDKANLGSPTKKGRKDKPHVILFCQFTKLIICHLGRIHNIHQRSTSPFHLAEEDLRLGNLKFVPKCEKDKVFGMPIPNELISNNFRNAPYYNTYLQMVAKHDQKVAAEKEGKKKSTSTKQPKPKPAKEKSTKATPLQKAGRGKVVKVHTMKSSLQLVDEPDEEPAHSEPEPEPKHQGVAIQEPVTEAIRPLPVVEGKDAETMAESDKTNSGCETEILQIAKEPGEDVTNQVNLEEKTAKLDQDQTGSDPGESLESRPQPEQVHMDEDQDGPDPGISRVALAGPDPEPTHDKFMADLYPKVQESLKFLADEHVILEDPLSSTRTLSSMKNLEDEYAIRDQFINEKSTDDEPGKLNVEVEVVSMVTVPIYQASSSIPPLSTPVIDLSPLKPASSTTQTPIFTATTITTSLPPPPQ